MLGLVSSAVATSLGTVAAIGIARHNFPGRRYFLAVSAMPMVIPYVVLGVALMILFALWCVPLSLWTVGVAHVVINVPYAMLIVASRLAGFDKNLEELGSKATVAAVVGDRTCPNHRFRPGKGGSLWIGDPEHHGGVGVGNSALGWPEEVGERGE